MYLLIAEEGSNSKWNPTESIIKILVPLFWPSFQINCKSSNWCQGNKFYIQDMTEDACFKETLNQGGRGREEIIYCRVNLQG